MVEWGSPGRPGRRRWRTLALALTGLLVGGLIVHGALTSTDVPPAVARPSAPPPFTPDPALAAEAGSALPGYPGTVPPVGYLDAGTRFVGVYGDTPGRRVQVDVACAGAGAVVLGAYPDGARLDATDQVLATATVPCSKRPAAVTIAINAPPVGRYQLIFASDAAAGVLAWRIIPW